jgi:hypothetical protein
MSDPRGQKIEGVEGSREVIGGTMSCLQGALNESLPTDSPGGRIVREVRSGVRWRLQLPAVRPSEDG